MKKIFYQFWQILIFLPTFFMAQIQTYTKSMDSLMVNVNRSQMTTNTLYDKVYSFANLDQDALPVSPSYTYFVQSWNELYNAGYSPSFLSATALEQKAKTSIGVAEIPLGIINMKMNYIDFGTDTAPNLFFTDGFFQNVPRRNPFKEKLISMLYPLAKQVNTSTAIYTISPEFMAQDQYSPAITSIQADLGDGLIRTFNLGGNSFAKISQSITYPTSGTKTLSFKINYANATSKSIQQSIVVNLPANLTQKLTAGTYSEAEDFVGSGSITQTIPFQGYNETTATSGNLEYRTYYNTITNPGFDPATRTFSIQPKLRKPVIILDGYDPGDGRKIYPQSSGYLSEKSSLYELMIYDTDNIPNNGNEKNLVRELQSKGYDVTLVNFPNGADFIERNAMALVALLQRENTKLKNNGSTEKIAIVGPSMGGLVSRYALAYLEKNNLPHNTKLWVSFDSPHLGANIPFSMQANLFFFGTTGESQDAKNKFIENFFSPAARQMLIEQMDNYPNPTAFNSGVNRNNNHPFRKQFMQNLTSNGIANSNGFPKLTRNIAIVNGTTTGQKTNTEGQALLEMAGFGPFKLKAVTMVDYAMAST